MKNLFNLFQKLDDLSKIYPNDQFLWNIGQSFWKHLIFDCALSWIFFHGLIEIILRIFPKSYLKLKTDDLIVSSIFFRAKSLQFVFPLIRRGHAKLKISDDDIVLRESVTYLSFRNEQSGGNRSRFPIRRNRFQYNAHNTSRHPIAAQFQPVFELFIGAITWNSTATTTFKFLSDASRNRSQV